MSQLLHQCLNSHYAETVLNAGDGIGAHTRFQEALAEHQGFRQEAEAKLAALSLVPEGRCHLTQTFRDFLQRELGYGS